MNILLLEDDQTKSDEIAVELRVISPSAKVTSCLSYQAGLKALLSGQYDLIVLDMSMPTFDKTAAEPTGGRFRHFAGRDLLHHIKRRKLKTSAVVVTAFDAIGLGAERIKLEELDKQLSRTFKGVYLGSTYYSRSTGKWRHELSALLSTVSRKKK